MSGFDAAWLALREPVDHASRNADIAERVRRQFAGRETLAVVDLGCGTGSNLRALAPSLSPRQRWHLVDGDRELLLKARERLDEWADSARASPEGIVLQKDGREIDVKFECADLTARDLRFSDVGPDLVTAAALFDLVSRGWLERLVRCLAELHVPVYAVLNYDGVARWSPAGPLDDRVVAAFNRHQRGDKGFGPALGPDSGATLAHLLEQHGYQSWTGDSPWRLGVAQSGLIAAVTEGFAAAAGEIEPASRAAFETWGRDRAMALAAVIGHQDVFAHA